MLQINVGERRGRAKSIIRSTTSELERRWIMNLNQREMDPPLGKKKGLEATWPLRNMSSGIWHLYFLKPFIHEGSKTYRSCRPLVNKRGLRLIEVVIKTIFLITFFPSSDLTCIQGGIPYPGIRNRELLRLLKSGYRMEKPAICSDEL